MELYIHDNRRSMEKSREAIGRQQHAYGVSDVGLGYTHWGNYWGEAPDTRFAKLLLDHGANVNVRASIRRLFEALGRNFGKSSATRHLYLGETSTPGKP
jgi:hypothetical protein